MIDYKITMSGNDYESDQYKARLRECHKRGAERVLDLCRANGGVFIKGSIDLRHLNYFDLVGQHISSLEYLIPSEYTETLSVLHSRAPESDIDEIRQVFREGVGKEVSLITF